MTTANLNVRQILIKRGNTSTINSYVGPIGELALDANLLQVHIQDGITPGGILLANQSSIGNIAGINLTGNASQILRGDGTWGADQTTYSNSNVASYLTTYTGNINAGNISINGKITANNLGNVSALNLNNNANHVLHGDGSWSADLTDYSNANVKTYLSTFDGNIIPSANLIYSLGDSTHQWKDLWVSNNTIYLNSIPISIDASGTFLVNNFPITGTTANLVNGASTFQLFANGQTRSPDTIFAANGVTIIDANGVIQGGIYNSGDADFFNIGASTGRGFKFYVNEESEGPQFFANGNIQVPGNIISGTSHINFVANSSGDGYGFSTIELRPDVNAYDDSYLIIDPTYPSHIHIRAGGAQDNSLTQLFLGGENSHFRVDSGSDPSVYIRSNSNDWTFGTDGNLTIGKTSPYGGINRGIVWDWGLGQAALGLGEGEGSNSYIRQTENGLEIHPNEPGPMADGDFRIITGNISPEGTSYTWIFNGTGELTFPTGGNVVFDSSAASVIDGISSIVFADATVQTTAWTGANIGNIASINLDGNSSNVLYGNGVFAGATVNSGASGYSGVAGAEGTSGYSGYSGISGQDGVAGASGYSGVAGSAGSEGNSGYSGYSGLNGTEGTSGYSGISGQDGVAGASGYSGISGQDGVAGASGYSGQDGLPGISGYSGISGQDGVAGASGYSGEPGPSGYSGYSGLDGAAASSGYSGMAGAEGASGYSGVSGYSGATGLEGTSGYSGVTGPEGTSGYSGYSGIAGTTGTSGYSGIAGSTGTSGYSGATGPVAGSNTQVIFNDNNVAAGSANLTFNKNTNTLSVIGDVSVTTGNISGNTAGFAIGYRDIPQVSFVGNTTVSTTDSGKHYYSTQSTNYTLTVANNASVSFSIGAAIQVVNQGTGTITIAPGVGVTLYLAGNSTASSRTLSSYGMVSLQKVATDTWFLSGVGLA